MWIQSIISVFLRIRPWCSKAATDIKCPLNTKVIMRTSYQVCSRENIFSLPYIKPGISAKGNVQTAKHCIKKSVSLPSKQFRILVSSHMCYSIIFRNNSNVIFVCLFVCLTRHPRCTHYLLIFGKLHGQWMSFLCVEHARVLRMCEERVWSAMHTLHAPSQNDVSQS